MSVLIKCHFLGEPIEQAYGALFLASSESSFVTGTDFKVDGGLTSAYVVSSDFVKVGEKEAFNDRVF